MSTVVAPSAVLFAPVEVREGNGKPSNTCCEARESFVNFLGKQYVNLINKACCNHLRIAAIVRLALNTLCLTSFNVGLVRSLSCIHPILGVGCGLIGAIFMTKLLTESFLKEWNIANGSPIAHLSFA